MSILLVVDDFNLNLLNIEDVLRVKLLNILESLDSIQHILKCPRLLTCSRGHRKRNQILFRKIHNRVIGNLKVK